MKAKERVRLVVLAASLWVLAMCTLAAFDAVGQTTTPRNAALITWTNATQNTDNSAIPASCPSGQTQCGRLLNTRIEYGSCNGTAFGTKVGEITTAFPGAQVLVSDLVVQTYCFRGLHRNDYNRESVVSNVATKTIEPPTPKPPTIQVAVDSFAYELREVSGELVAKHIGYLTPGALCHSERMQRIAGDTYGRVDPLLVRPVVWPLNKKMQDVYAKCG